MTSTEGAVAHVYTTRPTKKEDLDPIHLRGKFFIELDIRTMSREARLLSLAASIVECLRDTDSYTREDLSGGIRFYETLNEEQLAYVIRKQQELWDKVKGLYEESLVTKTAPSDLELLVAGFCRKEGLAIPWRGDDQ